MFLDFGEVALCRRCHVRPSSALSSHHQGPEVSWSQGSIWPVFADLVCRLQNCSVLASGVCPQVGEAGVEAYAGFLAGGASACPLVRGVGSWPSGGQGHA